MSGIFDPLLGTKSLIRTFTSLLALHNYLLYMSTFLDKFSSLCYTSIMKICNKCKLSFENNMFYKNNRTKDKLTPECKLCIKLLRHEFYKNHKEEKQQYNKEYNLLNSNKISKQKKEYYKQNHQQKKEYEYQRRKLKEVKQYRKEYAKEYQKSRKKTDIQFLLASSLRRRLWNALQGNFKAGSAVQDLGCSIDDLKIHLEKQFKDGMTWDNYGNKEGQWSIDHIIPLSFFDLTNREEFMKACHYTNLQPMWHIDNIKKNNKI